MAHDPVAFEEMLQYLYKDQFKLTKWKSTEARLKEIHELMSLAKHYLLPDLQKQVVALFSKSKMISKMTPTRYFDWAEDMFYEDIDHENGAFKTYLARVAPSMIKELEEAKMKELFQMVKSGGGFAEELFKAVYEVWTYFLLIQ